MLERNEEMRAKQINTKSNIIGKNIKKYRAQFGYTQEELCNKLDLYGLNLYHSDIYLIEHSKRIVKDFEVLAFTKVFNISLDELYKGCDKELE